MGVQLEVAAHWIDEVLTAWERRKHLDEYLIMNLKRVKAECRAAAYAAARDEEKRAA